MLKLSSNVSLKLQQAAGNISGNGAIKDLKIELAAGQVIWKDLQMPIDLEVAAGNIELKASSWPKEGSSEISVATGNVSIESPKGSSVSTEITKAMGVSKNDFPATNKGHKLKIDLALGKVSHLAY